MPSHFSTIGFRIEDEEEFAALAERAAAQGEHLPVRAGAYVRWAPGAGVEVWVQVTGREIVGLVPHFGGDARMPVAVTSVFREEGGTEFDGAVHAWAHPDPASDDPESGVYPFVFDVPDVLLAAPAGTPGRRDVQLAAFAHELVTFADEEAFEREQEEPQFAPESFVPTGLFGDGDAGAQATALFHGTVLAGELRTNPATELPFVCARVRTLGGEIDVVADPEIAPEAPPAGAIVRCSAWLSGRLQGEEPARPRRRWLRRR